MKAGCSCLLPYVQKLVTMQCDELGFLKVAGLLCKELKKTQTQSAKTFNCTCVILLLFVNKMYKSIWKRSYHLICSCVQVKLMK